MELLDQLRSDGLIRSAGATARPLTGGVSSDIYLIEDEDRRFVVKRALGKLKVAQDWFADTSRNGNEYAYLQYVAGFDANIVPTVIGDCAPAGYFCMEYLGEGYDNWKSQLLAGECNLATAAEAGRLLGAIHGHSYGDPQAARTFDTLANFEQLRIDPYLIATARRYPDLRAAIFAEADRLRGQRQVLTHGDFSPKNILVGKSGRVVLVDCEVAWYGDAAFDLAFLMNHLFLKALRWPGKVWRAMIEQAWGNYLKACKATAVTDTISANVARLLPMLMLARVDGKSPVEYLNLEQQALVRQFTRDEIAGGNTTEFVDLTARWLAQLDSTQ